MDLVGARSAGQLALLRPAWRAAPPAAAYSLRGGVLRWWAEGLPLAGGGVLRLPPGGWDALAARLPRGARSSDLRPEGSSGRTAAAADAAQPSRAEARRPAPEGAQR
jgi:hypothetical protein